MASASARWCSGSGEKHKDDNDDRGRRGRSRVGATTVSPALDLPPPPCSSIPHPLHLAPASAHDLRSNSHRQSAAWKESSRYPSRCCSIPAHGTWGGRASTSSGLDLVPVRSSRPGSRRWASKPRTDEVEPRRRGREGRRRRPPEKRSRIRSRGGGSIGEEGEKKRRNTKERRAATVVALELLE